MLTLVLGGARSGKSRYAQSLCRRRDDVVFIATATASGDPEMRRRIERHRSERPASWTTVEAPFELAEAVRNAPAGALVLVDCVTLWLSNLSHRHRALMPGVREKRILGEVGAFAEVCRSHDVIAVSNEVGGGIVPETSVGREFRDLQGLANQRLAAEASRVVLMVAGLPMTVKDEPGNE